MQDLTLDETLLARKHGYKCFLGMHGIVSKGYHADNGRFADEGFCDDHNGQTFCFAVLEAIIRMDSTLGARTLLLHAKYMLPEYINIILWPFALIYYEDRMNNLVHCANGWTPHQALLVLDAVPSRTSTLLAVLVMFCTIACNQATQ